MSALPIAIQRTGLVTSVGLSAQRSCAALRAKVSNPTETQFFDSDGDAIMAHQVPFERPWRGLTKLAKMGAWAIGDALQCLPRAEWRRLPLLLCVAEPERPGRMTDLDDRLFTQIESELGSCFAPQSAVIAQGHVGVAAALARARVLIGDAGAERVLVVATDSLLSWRTLSCYSQQDRLLSPRNSDGFMPGEAAGALLLGAPDPGRTELLCTGIGFGHEAAPIASRASQRANGLSQAIGNGLAEAGCQMHDMDFRITDNAGEHYYFKESALALSRTLRRRKDAFDIWHPAECTGEVGAAVGTMVVALAEAAWRKGYHVGTNILAHWANDAGQRASVCLQGRVIA